MTTSSWVPAQARHSCPSCGHKVWIRQTVTGLSEEWDWFCEECRSHGKWTPKLGIDYHHALAVWEWEGGACNG